MTGKGRPSRLKDSVNKERCRSKKIQEVHCAGFPEVYNKHRKSQDYMARKETDAADINTKAKSQMALDSHRVSVLDSVSVGSELCETIAGLRVGRRGQQGQDCSCSGGKR